MLYLTDIKTRGSDQLPRASQMKQTEMQLMMYRRLLLELAANTVTPDIIFERYDVDPNTPFSDTFIASMGSIDFSSTPSSSMARSDETNDANDEFFTPQSSQPPQDPLEEVLQHTTLTSLWAHMIAEFARTISVNLSSSNVSDLLTAEFRKSDTGRVIGTRSFEYDWKELEPYVKDVMKWWKGEREPRGVEIEEAVKCRFCEFAEGCEWRKGKVVEVLEKGRLKKEERKRSRV
jgi:exonuclease V